MASAIGEMKLETQQIQKLLLKLEDDEVLTYDAIQKAIGVNVQNGSRGLLRTAIKHAEEETKRLFGTVFGVGVKRLVPGASCGELVKTRDRMRSSASKAIKRSANIDYVALNPQQRNEVNVYRTLIHFAGEALAEKQTKRVASAVEQFGDVMGFAKLMEHLK